MRRGNVFGFVIFVVLAVFLLWAWSLMAGDFASITQNTINSTSTAEHSGALEFVLRTFVWAVPLIILVGLLFWGLAS